MMLTRALRPNLEALRDATKLLIWSQIRKAEFCSFEDRDDFYPNKNRFYRRENNDRGFFEDNRYSSFNRRRNFPRRDFDDDFYEDGGFNRRKRKFMDLRNEDRVFNENLKPHIKDFYKPHPNVLNRSAEEINKFREEHDIQVFGKNRANCPPPILNFNELELPSEALDVVRKLDYTNPTPVQSQTWPIALSGSNMVGVSQTGSGKTLGFVLPALIHIQHQSPIENGEGPIALMIAPTRELVQQILEVIRPFARRLNLRVACLFGGSDKRAQVRKLLGGAEICIATPGRLNDLLNSDYVTLNRCTYFVLDEADRLLDMGFHPQIKSIFHYCRPDRQVLMWSATWPKEVQSLAETFLKDYIAVKFGSAELTVNPHIKQFVHVCEEREKFSMLKDLLKKINENDDNKTLIFTQTKLKADRLMSLLKREGYYTDVIHGDRSQMQRDQALKRFRSGAVKILVGTLVVGRGIDITDIRYVVIYDFPNEIEDYVHVIGRTARNNNEGTSYAFFTYADQPKARDLIRILNQSNQTINPELEEMAHGRSRRRRQNSFDDWD